VAKQLYDIRMGKAKTEEERKLAEQEYEQSLGIAREASRYVGMNFWDALWYRLTGKEPEPKTELINTTGNRSGGGVINNFTFNGDVNDREALERSIMDMMDRQAQLGALQG
jgi:hypothetical protein